MAAHAKNSHDSEQAVVGGAKAKSHDLTTLYTALRQEQCAVVRRILQEQCAVVRRVLRQEQCAVVRRVLQEQCAAVRRVLQEQTEVETVKNRKPKEAIKDMGFTRPSY
jgi:membrane carboxypeptidase/penicillin-binding protein PbpC